MWPFIKLLPNSFHFRFVKWSPYTGMVSGMLLVASVVLFFTRCAAPVGRRIQIGFSSETSYIFGRGKR